MFKHLNKDIMRVIARMVYATRKDYVMWSSACFVMNIRIESTRSLERVKEDKKKKLRAQRDWNKFQNSRKLR